MTPAAFKVFVFQTGILTSPLHLTYNHNQIPTLHHLEFLSTNSMSTPTFTHLPAKQIFNSPLGAPLLASGAPNAKLDADLPHLPHTTTTTTRSKSTMNHSLAAKSATVDLTELFLH